MSPRTSTKEIKKSHRFRLIAVARLLGHIDSTHSKVLVKRLGTQPGLLEESQSEALSELLATEILSEEAVEAICDFSSKLASDAKILLPHAEHPAEESETVENAVALASGSLRPHFAIEEQAEQDVGNSALVALQAPPASDVETPARYEAGEDEVKFSGEVDPEEPANDLTMKESLDETTVMEVLEEDTVVDPDSAASTPELREKDALKEQEEYQGVEDSPSEVVDEHAETEKGDEEEVLEDAPQASQDDSQQDKAPAKESELDETSISEDAAQESEDTALPRTLAAPPGLEANSESSDNKHNKKRRKRKHREHSYEREARESWNESWDSKLIRVARVAPDRFFEFLTALPVKAVDFGREKPIPAISIAVGTLAAILGLPFLWPFVTGSGSAQPKSTSNGIRNPVTNGNPQPPASNDSGEVSNDSGDANSEIASNAPEEPESISDTAKDVDVAPSESSESDDIAVDENSAIELPAPPSREEQLLASIKEAVDKSDSDTALKQIDDYLADERGAQRDPRWAALKGAIHLAAGEGEKAFELLRTSSGYSSPEWRIVYGAWLIDSTPEQRGTMMGLLAARSLLNSDPQPQLKAWLNSRQRDARGALRELQKRSPDEFEIPDFFYVACCHFYNQDISEAKQSLANMDDRISASASGVEQVVVELCEESFRSAANRLVNLAEKRTSESPSQNEQ